MAIVLDKQTCTPVEGSLCAEFAKMKEMSTSTLTWGLGPITMLFSELPAGYVCSASDVVVAMVRVNLLFLLSASARCLFQKLSLLRDDHVCFVLAMMAQGDQAMPPGQHAVGAATMSSLIPDCLCLLGLLQTPRFQAFLLLSCGN